MIRPYRLHRLAYQHVKELDDAIKQSPYNLTPEKLWDACKNLNRPVAKKNTRTRITDLTLLMRFVSGQQDMLVLYRDFAMDKFEKWLETQKASSALFTFEHETWLQNIADQISTSCQVSKKDIQSALHDRDELIKFRKLFPNGDQMPMQIHEELTNND